ncbi:MAG: MGMT family protein [Gammaproteobacteria bacterium]|jgi:methylated-DNA-protein-cysteine methyltransferase-like protein|nr:MGMT family protein [Gammaproteobacteria bacterium]MBT5725464.1 MGMT family protein [Gammaproteobacteria bacterium]
MAESQQNTQGRVWQIVHQIPKGRVATYGQIASMAGIPRHSRLIGRILSGLPPKTRLPWHRVINSQGRITNPAKDRQQARLEKEGVTLINGRVNLKVYGWDAS